MHLKRIFLLHGFNAAPTVPPGRKARFLRSKLPKCHIHEPCVEYHHIGWYEALSRSLQHTLVDGCQGLNPESDLLMGTSMGGFTALLLSQENGIRALVMNPALNPSRALESARGSQTNYDTGERYVWGDAQLSYLAELERRFNWNVGKERLHVAVGLNDDVLPPQPTIEHFERHGIPVSQWPDDHRMNEALPRIISAVFPTFVGVTLDGDAPAHPV